MQFISEKCALVFLSCLRSNIPTIHSLIHSFVRSLIHLCCTIMLCTMHKSTFSNSLYRVHMAQIFKLLQKVYWTIEKRDFILCITIACSHTLTHTHTWTRTKYVEKIVILPGSYPTWKWENYLHYILQYNGNDDDIK
jgi:hypothetical protein